MCTHIFTNPQIHKYIHTSGVYAHIWYIVLSTRYHVRGYIGLCTVCVNIQTCVAPWKSFVATQTTYVATRKAFVATRKVHVAIRKFVAAYKHSNHTKDTTLHDPCNLQNTSLFFLVAFCKRTLFGQGIVFEVLNNRPISIQFLCKRSPSKTNLHCKKHPLSVFCSGDLFLMEKKLQKTCFSQWRLVFAVETCFWWRLFFCKKRSDVHYHVCIYICIYSYTYICIYIHVYINI